MSLSPNNTPSPSIVDDIRAKILDIKEKLKSSDITTKIFSELSKQAKTLQDKLDEILSKGGILTQSDINDAYEKLQEVRRREMQRMAQSSTRKFVAYALLFTGIVVGAYYLAKRNRR